MRVGAYLGHVLQRTGIGSLVAKELGLLQAEEAALCLFLAGKLPHFVKGFAIER